MSVRKERFCDFMKEEKPDYMGNIPKPTEQCTNPASGTCFFCKRDYCREHGGSTLHGVALGLSGFKQDFGKVLPCCQKCEGQLPYNPDAVVLKHFERCWLAIKRNIRAEIKSARTTAEAAREKRRARAAKLEPKAEGPEAVAEAADAKPEVNKEMAPIEDQIDEVFSSLSPREQRVLQLRFGLEDGRGRNLEEVGKEFGVTRERIRQIEAKALRKLRHPSRSRKLKDYLDEEKPHDQWTPVDKLLRAIFGERIV